MPGLPKAAGPVGVPAGCGNGAPSGAGSVTGIPTTLWHDGCLRRTATRAGLHFDKFGAAGSRASPRHARGPFSHILCSLRYICCLATVTATPHRCCTRSIPHASPTLAPASPQAQGLSSLLWSFARQGHQPPPRWMESFLACCAADLPAFAPQHMATLLWALAKLHYKVAPARLNMLLAHAQVRYPWRCVLCCVGLAGAPFKCVVM